MKYVKPLFIGCPRVKVIWELVVMMFYIRSLCWTCLTWIIRRWGKFWEVENGRHKFLFFGATCLSSAFSLRRENNQKLAENRYKGMLGTYLESPWQVYMRNWQKHYNLAPHTRTKAAHHLSRWHFRESKKRRHLKHRVSEPPFQHPHRSRDRAHCKNRNNRNTIKFSPSC
jgi:hypothetical protein